MRRTRPATSPGRRTPDAERGWKGPDDANRDVRVCSRRGAGGESPGAAGVPRHRDLSARGVCRSTREGDGADRRRRGDRARHDRAARRDAVPPEQPVLLSDRRDRAARERHHRRPDEDDDGVSAAEDGEAGQQPVRAGHGAGHRRGHGARRGCRSRPRGVHGGDHRAGEGQARRSTRRSPPRCSAVRARAIRRACGRTTRRTRGTAATRARRRSSRSSRPPRPTRRSRTSIRCSTRCAR